jgi:diguanylate cyclase (GGDEF)-like protein
MNIGLLLINIDRFKAVNDEHGISFGDEFLKLYAKTIKNSIRTSDIAIRFSGGEFLVLLINIIDEEKTIDIAHTIKDKLSNIYLKTPYGDNFKKTVCVGVSMFPHDSSDIDIVVQNTHIALSDAKDIGRNKVVRFSKDEDGEIDLF